MAEAGGWGVKEGCTFSVHYIEVAIGMGRPHLCSVLPDTGR